MSDEGSYLIATNEVDRGDQDPALWAKAMALHKGDEVKARYEYIEIRVQNLESAPAKEVQAAFDKIEAKKIVDNVFHPKPISGDRSKKDTNKPKLPDNYISVSDYAKQNMLALSIVRLRLNTGELEGMEIGGIWYLPKNNGALSATNNDIKRVPSGHIGIPKDHINHKRFAEENGVPPISVIELLVYKELQGKQIEGVWYVKRGQNMPNKKLSEASNSNDTNKNSNGVGRLGYFLWMLVFLIISVLLKSFYSRETGLIFFGAMMVTTSFYRFKNIGSNPYFALTALIPIVSIFTYWKAFALPTNYQQHKTMDFSGRIVQVIYVIFWLIILAVILPMIWK